MAVYKISEECESDIAGMYEYGIEKYGLRQAQNYIVELEGYFQTICNNAEIGTDCFELFPLLRKFYFKAHIIFYLKREYGIFIVRVLGKRMDYEHQLKAK